MSDLEKALEWWDDYTERKALMIPTGPFTDVLIEAARRFASLTSPETIEKGHRAAFVAWCEHNDPLPSDTPETYNERGMMQSGELAEAVLRSVEEGTQ